MDFLVGTIFLIIIVIIFISFSCTLKRDIIDTSETALLITLANMTIIFWMVVSSMFGFLLTYYIITIKTFIFYKQLLTIPMILILYFPIFSVIYSYFNLINYYRKKFKLKPLSSNNKKSLRIIKLTKNIAKNLCLKRPPNVWYSAYYNVKPFIFGKNSNNCHLVLPFNYEEIILNLPINNENIKKDLENFLVGHELSHIKNNDFYFMSFSSIIAQSMIKWLIIFSIIQVGYELCLPTSVFTFHYALSFPLVISIVLFYKIYLSVSQKREFLADARASLSITPRKLNHLSSRTLRYKLTNVSPIELLLSSIRRLSQISYKNKKNEKLEFISFIFKYINKTFNLFNDFTIKIKLAYLSTIKKLKKYFNKTHPHDSFRNDFIYNKIFLNLYNPIPTRKTVIYMGIINALIYYLMIIFMAIMYGFYELFGISTEPPFHYIFLILILMILATSILFCIPLRNSINKSISYKKYTKNILIRYIQSSASFFLFLILLFFSIIILSLLDPGHFEFKDIIAFLKLQIPYLIIFCISAAALSLLFSSIMIGEKYSKYIMKKMLAVGLVMFVFLAICFIFVKFVLMPETKIWYLFISLFIGVSFIAFFKPIDIRFKKLFITVRIINKYFRIDLNPSNKLKNYFSYFLISLFASFYYLAGPMIIIHFLIYSIASRYLISFYSSSIVTVIFAIICSIICSIKKEYFNIKNIRWKAELNHFFKLELSKKDLKTHTNLLFEFKNKRLVYNNSSIKFSYLDLTDIYHFITSKYYIYGYVSKELIDYVLKCEDKNGGFKNFPDGLTNLESAYYAINTLDLTTDLRKIDKRKHIVWICSFNIKEESLKDIYYAIASLNILNSTKDIRSLKLKQYIKEKYNFSQKDYSDTYFFLSSLNMLDSLSNDIKEKVINYWIPIHESIALNYRVDANYEELFYYLNILRILGITNKSLIPDKIKEALQTT